MADANLVRDLMGLGFSPFQATYLGDLLGDSSSPLPIANGGSIVPRTTHRCRKVYL
jgi:hypothetical protein